MNYEGPERRNTSVLTEDDIDTLHEMIEEKRRWKWAFGIIRTAAMWITAVVGGLYIGWQAIKDFVAAAGRGAP